MVLAYHAIWGAYGFWLPNDPRGSWSEFVGSWELFRFGPATKVHTARSLARDEHDVARRLAAKSALKHPAVQLTGLQARAVGRAFAAAAARIDLSVWACSILPDHVHLVVGRHRHPVERIVRFLKAEATKALRRQGLGPRVADAAGDGAPVARMWAKGFWKVFLDDPAGVRRAILYVRDNPLKEGRPVQRWSFVRAFDGA